MALKQGNLRISSLSYLNPDSEKMVAMIVRVVDPIQTAVLT